MRDALVYLDNYMLGHAEALAGPASARGLELVVIGHPGAAARIEGAAEAIEVERFDEPQLREALHRAERNFRIRGLRCPFGIPEAGRLLAGLAADARAERGLSGPGRSALEIANNKYLTRLALERAGLGGVAFALVRSAAEARQFAAARRSPVLLKPLTGVGASLVARCEGPEEAERKFAQFVANVPLTHHAPLRIDPYESVSGLGALRFDPRRSALIEEFIEGPELSVECLCLGEQTIPLVVHDKVLMEEADWTVREHVLVAPPTRFAPAVLSAVKEYAVRCVRAIGLTDSLCHVELRLRHGSEPVLLEINPRIGAGCVRDSLATFWGCDQYETELALAIGEVPRLSVFERTDRRHAMIFLFSARNGRLDRLSGLERVLRQPGVLAVRSMAVEGERVGGSLEEHFLAGIWRRLEDGESPQDAYAATLRAADIEISS